MQILQYPGGGLMAMIPDSLETRFIASHRFSGDAIHRISSIQWRRDSSRLIDSVETRFIASLS